MRTYKADLHNHTVLSPCGDIEMTPMFILSAAREKGYDVIGITDHNTTLQGREIRRIASGNGPYILCGAEITTKEEAHCLAFADSDDDLDKLQSFLEEHLPKIKNDTEYFGYQLLVNEHEEVLKEEEYLLISALDKSLDEIEKFVHSIGGIFIPAHIDKPQYSVISQLGFIPPDLEADAVEFSKNCDVENFIKQNKYLKRYTKIRSSDAHYPDDFASAATFLEMEDVSFEEIKMALRAENGRNCRI